MTVRTLNLVENGDGREPRVMVACFSCRKEPLWRSRAKPPLELDLLDTRSRADIEALKRIAKAHDIRLHRGYGRVVVAKSIPSQGAFGEPSGTYPKDKVIELARKNFLFHR